MLHTVSLVFCSFRKRRMISSPSCTRYDKSSRSKFWPFKCAFDQLTQISLWVFALCLCRSSGTLTQLLFLAYWFSLSQPTGRIKKWNMQHNRRHGLQFICNLHILIPADDATVGICILKYLFNQIWPTSYVNIKQWSTAEFLRVAAKLINVFFANFVYSILYFLSIHANINWAEPTVCIVSRKPSNSPAGREKLQAHVQSVFSASVWRCFAPWFCLEHVSVKESGQGQKAAALIETRWNLEKKKWTKRTWWWPMKGRELFFNNVSKLLLHDALGTCWTHRCKGTAILVNFYLHAHILRQIKPVVEKIKEWIRQGDCVCADVINRVSGCVWASL